MRAALAFLLALAASITTASARTWYIVPDGSGDAPTIQAGIDSAAAGDTVLLADGTFLGSGNRDLTFAGKRIRLASSSAEPESCIIDCQGGPYSIHRGITFTSGETNATVLESITIQHGYLEDPGTAGGGILCAGASPTIRNCILRWNVARGGGGGMWCGSGIIEGCLFLGNSSEYGGGICSSGSTPTIRDCRFVNNGGTGGGIACLGGTIRLDNCSLLGNTAHQGPGGGVYCEMDASAYLYNCELIGNDAGAGGGAYAYVHGLVSLTDCLVEENTAGSGGACATIFGGISLERCTVVGNSAENGGAVFSQFSGPEIRNCTLVRNDGTSGCAIYVEGMGHPDARLCLENTIIGCGGPGASVVCADTVAMDISCCDIFGNQGGDYVGCLSGLEGMRGNISADPLFCDTASQDYSLHENSPCAPDSDPDPECALIGAWGVGCSAVGCTLQVVPPRIVTYYPCQGFYSLGLMVNDVSDLGAFEVCAGYDNSLAQFVGCRPDTAFLESTGRDFYDLDPVACASTCQVSGKRVGAWSLGEDPGPSGDGALGRIDFWRESDVASEDSVCLEDWELVDTELPPGLIEVAETTGARISHRSFCYGDFNDDGDISVSDIMEVSGRWGCCEGEACYADMFDVNLIEPGNYCMSAPDSCIDIVDIQEVAARWGLGCPGVVHAPHFAVVLDQKLRVSPDTLTVVAEGRETATLDVVVDDAYDLGALEMTVRFDPSVIRVEGVMIGDFLASTGRSVYPLGPQIDNELGEVKFGAWTTGETPGPEGSGVIARLVLTGGSQEGETAIEVTEAKLAYTHGWPQTVSEVESGVVRTVLSTAVPEPGAAVPRSYALFQNVPNPFNPLTTIGFALPKAGHLTLTVHDVSGRRVAVLADGRFDAGEFTRTWDGRDADGFAVPSGVYFARMAAGDFAATQKMMLLR